jgi:uracil-DNA glycosylase family 4
LSGDTTTAVPTIHTTATAARVPVPLLTARANDGKGREDGQESTSPNPSIATRFTPRFAATTRLTFGWRSENRGISSFRRRYAILPERVALASPCTLPQMDIAALHQDLVNCRLCPRLVSWREEAGRHKRAAYRDWEYWARPVPGFGDSRARLLIVGLAPAAHGANRTGRMFTGDRSGDWLFRALNRAGFANQPEAVSRDDGLTLTDAFVASIVRCAPPENKPLPSEREHCRGWLEAELDALRRVEVIIPLGGIAYAQVLRILQGRQVRVPKPRPRFAHGLEVDLRPAGPMLIASYHPSQQNTFTGRLTEKMLDEVFERAKGLLE